MAHDNIDPILQNELNRNLRGLRHLTAGIALSAVDSTNEAALVLAKQGAPTGTVIMACTQTNGRGRHHRKWFTEQEDLAMSIIVRPAFSKNQWSLMALLPGVAVTTGLAQHRVPVFIKWPNDIVMPKLTHEPDVAYFADFRKLGGILVENVVLDDSLTAIVGIGLNIRPLDERIKAEIPHIATLAPFSHCTRESCAKAILHAFDQLLDQVKDAHFTAMLRASYRKTCVTLGRDVVVRTNSHAIAGKALALTDDGALKIHDGITTHIVHAGDVTFARTS